MVIVFAVVLVVVGVMIYTKRRGARADGLNREDIPEEVLARMMQGEYPQYRQVFEDQARSKLAMIMPRI